MSPQEQQSLNNTESWMQTWGPDGKAIAFNPLRPTPDMIRIEGIAHALSHQCRFAGHCKEFFSVAQHSLIVSNLCDPADALWGLLHDAPEAYIVDIPNPLKRAKEFAWYYVIEFQIMSAVSEHFGITYSMPASVKEADIKALAWEVRDNLQPKIEEIWMPLPVIDYVPLHPVGPAEAKKLFLDRFASLYHGPIIAHMDKPPLDLDSQLKMHRGPGGMLEEGPDGRLLR